MYNRVTINIMDDQLQANQTTVGISKKERENGETKLRWSAWQTLEAMLQRKPC